MTDDPIVAEVRRLREEIAGSFDYDIHKMFADLRTREASPDQSHPLVENAEAAAKDLLTLKEEPRNEGAR